MKEQHKTYKLQEEALKKAMIFYKEGRNKNLVCVFRKGLMTYKIIPRKEKENEFILISANNKYKYIKQIELLFKEKFNVILGCELLKYEENFKQFKNYNNEDKINIFRR